MLWSGIIRGFVSKINEVAGIANICQGDSKPQQLLEPRDPSPAAQPCWSGLLPEDFLMVRAGAGWEAGNERHMGEGLGQEIWHRLCLPGGHLHTTNGNQAERDQDSCPVPGGC